MQKEENNKNNCKCGHQCHNGICRFGKIIGDEIVMCFCGYCKCEKHKELVKCERCNHKCHNNHDMCMKISFIDGIVCSCKTCECKNCKNRKIRSKNRIIGNVKKKCFQCEHWCHCNKDNFIEKRKRCYTSIPTDDILEKCNTRIAVDKICKCEECLCFDKADKKLLGGFLGVKFENTSEIFSFLNKVKRIDQ